MSSDHQFQTASVVVVIGLFGLVCAFVMAVRELIRRNDRICGITPWRGFGWMFPDS
jgi:hypothetical protein